MHRPSNTSSDTVGTRRAVILTVAGIWLLLLAFTPPVMPKGDGSSMFAVAESIVTQGTITVSPDLGRVGRGGRFYSVWYPLLSLVLTPFAAVGERLASIVHLPPHYMAASTTLLFPALIIAANAFLTISLALRLGATVEGALWSGVAFVFGTIALVDSRELSADTLLAFLTVSAIYLALGEPKKPTNLLLCLTCGLSVLAKPNGLLVGFLVAAFVLLKRRDVGTAAAALAGSSVGLLLYLAYNDYRFGDPFFFGQPAVFKLSNIPTGLVGQLVSPGHGLFWYCPAVLSLFFLNKSILRRADVCFILGVGAAYLLSYSAWRVWDSGWSWGPRFLIVALPGLMTLTGFLDRRGRKGLVLLTIAGLIVAAPTLISNEGRVYVETAAIGMTDQTRDWSITEAPITASWGAADRTIRSSLQPENDVSSLVRQAGLRYHTTADEMPSLKVIAVWWWMLPAAHVPAWIGAVAALAMVLVGVGLIIRSLNIAHRIDIGAESNITDMISAPSARSVSALG